MGTKNVTMFSTMDGIDQIGTATDQDFYNRWQQFHQRMFNREITLYGQRMKWLFEDLNAGNEENNYNQRNAHIDPLINVNYTTRMNKANQVFENDLKARKKDTLNKKQKQFLKKELLMKKYEQKNLSICIVDVSDAQSCLQAEFRLFYVTNDYQRAHWRVRS